jgi:phosphate transport system permease protein
MGELSVKRPANAAPWTQRSGLSRQAIIAASALPLLISLAVTNLFSIPGFFAVLVIFLPLQLIFAAGAGRLLGTRNSTPDALLSVVTYFLVTLFVTLLGSLLLTLTIKGLESIKLNTLYQNNNYVSLQTPLNYGGVGHAILGTLIVVGLSALIAVPLGFSVAIYLTETRGRMRFLVRTIVQSLSGLPSIVSGLFIYAVVILPGYSHQVGFTGSLALALLMLPTVARTCEEVLKLVPADLRSAAVALGATRKAAFFKVIAPAAKTGLVTAVLLGIARVIGETAPLLLTTIPTSETSLNPFSGPMTTMPTYVYRYVTDPHDALQHRAWGASFLMMLIVVVIFGAARLIANRRPKSKQSKNN